MVTITISLVFTSTKQEYGFCFHLLFCCCLNPNFYSILTEVTEAQQKHKHVGEPAVPLGDLHSQWLG